MTMPGIRGANSPSVLTCVIKDDPVIGIGAYVDLVVPFNCAIIYAQGLSDQDGDIVVDIWKSTFAEFPPVNGDSITASAPITITAADSVYDATLTGWAKDLLAGDILRFNVDSCVDIMQVTLTLGVRKAVAN